ncbi:MAG TPA: hypothetical protein VFI42_02105, partial [Thermomicrobiaceae bacterium]|nr:hypothetical protein [Thermomicrobiaceae bacterium]
MTHMRRSAIFLFAIAFAALFFDRFVAPGRVGWELNPGLCLVAFSIVLVLIALPRLSRLSVFLWLSLWLGSYEFGRLIFLHEGLRPGGLSAHALGIETAFLAISIVLGHRFAQGLLDFEGAIRDVVLPATDKRIRRADEVDEEIQNILYRSRRYQRPLSLLVVEPDEETSRATLHRAVAEVQSALVGSYAISRLARVVCDTVRRSDLVFRHPAGLAILCQETNAQGTAELVGRVQRAAGVHGVSVAWGIASFPEEALTFDQLVHQA